MCLDMRDYVELLAIRINSGNVEDAFEEEWSHILVSVFTPGRDRIGCWLLGRREAEREKERFMEEKHAFFEFFGLALFGE